MEKESDRTKIAIVNFPRRAPERIYQHDLDEFLALTEKLRQAETRWNEKREYITSALQGGALIETGLHEAFLSRLIVR